ncbi:DUF5615 family PIN-like protein [Lewinella sp. LCG006]|uniref:DUF5615 family PIN-like protein n=1 Tax=Lewinella sp. LCG006 TaxID=3231911 RepID=UPI003460AF1A
MILFLADENFPLASHRFLKNKGFDIKHISLENLSSIKDTEVIEFALKENRIIITFDSDFGELIFKLNYKPQGVVFFRWPDFSPTEPGEYISELIDSGEIIINGYLTVIDRSRVRQKKIL